MKRNQCEASNEYRFKLAYFFLFVVGYGSFLFHATLRYFAQLADELPMLFLDFVFLFILAENASLIKKSPTYPQLPLIFIIACTTICSIYLWFSSVYIIFIFSYTSCVIVMVFWAVYCVNTDQLLYKLDINSYKTNRLVLRLSALFYISGVVIWIIERNFCKHTQMFHLHSCWHILAGIGTYCFILFGISRRTSIAYRKYPILKFSPLPFIVDQKPYKSL